MSQSTQTIITEANIDQLNQAIQSFPQVYPVTPEMTITHQGISRMVMLDRYTFKDTKKNTLAAGDLVVLTVKPDPQYPARGVGIVQSLDLERGTAEIWLEEEYRGTLTDPAEIETGIITRSIDELDKPLEIYYEQIAKRVARGLAEVESEANQAQVQADFESILMNKSFVPAGRVLYGAGSGADVTYFNCYIMPQPADSREGLAKHRAEAMEIMSRGGGIGTNGSTLRPRNTLARGVNGKSSGSVSWLNDLALLTHLIQQGGSRRGAQMIMMADWHPDIIEFIISKVQNPRILRFLIEKTQDPQIRQLAEEKLRFVPYTNSELEMYENIVRYKDMPGHGGFSEALIEEAEVNLRDKGVYEVQDLDFLTGANISVALSDDFMQAVKRNEDWALRFPDVEHYDEDQMAAYDRQWHHVGDVRDWEALGYPVRTYRTIPARELWQLINICATYSAEPGIFFIDEANEQTTATAYGQRVVATNPCGEQPLPAYSVCNLAAVNLAEMVDRQTGVVDYDKLKETVRIGIRMQDNVISATPYFLEANTKQALGERRIGMGVMGLADLLIYTGHVYGSEDGNQLVDEIFKTMAITGWQTSIELAKEKGSFPFLVGKNEEETQELRERFVNTGYIKKLPEALRADIMKYGVRNTAILTVAPTGSTGTMMNVSTGLEPYFAFKYYRSGRLGKFIEVNADIVSEYLERHPEVDADHLPAQFITAMDLSPEAHVDVQTTIQYWVDSSISKTVNAPRGYTVSQVAAIYERLYDGGAKGGTVYVDGSRDSQVLTLSAEDNDLENVQLFEMEETVIVEDVDQLQQLVDQANSEHYKQQGDTDDVVFGSEVGDTCPICRQGIVQDLGGCNTCTNCGAQLRCGL